MKLRKWLLLGSVFISYLMLGGVVFMNLERATEEKTRRELGILRQDIQNLFKIHEDLIKNGTSPEGVEEIQILTKSIFKRLGKIRGGTNVLDSKAPDREWNFYDSVFYCFTIVTTIGYGHLTPTSNWSRLVTVLYGLIGISLNGILLSTLGDYFSGQVMDVYNESSKDNRVVMLIKMACYLFPGTILFFLLPAGVIAGMEGWSFPESIYFVFISLTTIGFGDLIAGKQKGGKDFGIWTYKILIIVWIELGLSYLVMILAFITKGLRHEKFQSVIEKTINFNREQFFKDLEDMKSVMEFEFLRDNRGQSRQSRDAEKGSSGLISNIVKNVGQTGQGGLALQQQMFSNISRMLKNIVDTQNPTATPTRQIQNSKEIQEIVRTLSAHFKNNPGIQESDEATTTISQKNSATDFKNHAPTHGHPPNKSSRKNSSNSTATKTRSPSQTKSGRILNSAPIRSRIGSKIRPFTTAKSGKKGNGVMAWNSDPGHSTDEKSDDEDYVIRMNSRDEEGGKNKSGITSKSMKFNFDPTLMVFGPDFLNEDVPPYALDKMIEKIEADRVDPARDSPNMK